MFSSKGVSLKYVVTITLTVLFCDLKWLSLILRVSRDNTVFPVPLLPHRNNIFSGFSTGIGKCQSSGNYRKNKITDFFQQLSLNVVQLCQWIVGDGPQIMCEEHGGGDTTSSQQPGDVTVHTETESHHNDSRVKLRKCLIETKINL